MNKIKIGIIGLGTVGSGVYETLQGFDNIEITKIAVKDITKPRNINNLDKNLLTEDASEIVNNPDLQIVVELIGGIEPAFGLIKQAIKNGKHVVTANKELLAKHGEELFKFAEQHNKVVLYEASIAGGIPIIMPIKTILAGNKITKIEAILNGTTNYILTKMDNEGLSYEKVLKEAQELGYAEFDPTNDVEGFDSAYKLTTLATIAFNKRIKYEDVYREGITKITAEDIANANELGYKIKLIAHAEIDENSNADVRVHPTLVPKDDTLAKINYATNAITITGSPVGKITLSGAGAGSLPTASSVIGDILAIATELGTTDYLLPMMRCKHSSNATPIDISETSNMYYLSISAKNETGLLARVTEFCASQNVGISNIKGKSLDDCANIVLITDVCTESNINKLIKTMKENKLIKEVKNLIRVAR